MVCVGDFWQLSPVANDNYQDPGQFAFTSPVWKTVMGHKIMLTEVVRQDQVRLIQAINELEQGIPSSDTNQLMKDLARSLPPGDTPVVLCAENFQVDCHNSTMLRTLPGLEVTYTSEDYGEKNKLKKILAKKVLTLKEGSPVMLLKNMSSELVNGRMGTVIKLEVDGPTVKFGNTVIKLTKQSFSVYDAIKKKVVAERHQYPISLSFAITIHKSQGLTLPRVVVNCINILKPGQLGVAIGRAVNLEGLRVLHYRPACAMTHKPEVYEFYKEPSTPVGNDTSCCHLVRFLHRRG